MATTVSPIPEVQADRDEVDLYGLTHIGKMRRSNDDHFLILTLHKQVYVQGTSLPSLAGLPLSGQRIGVLLVVADGVGGSSGGGEASKTALESLATYVGHTMRCYYTGDPEREAQFMDALRQGVLTAHASVVQEARDRPEFRRMATTLTMLMGTWPHAYILHVGDSRCYFLRDGALRTMTRDQTMAQALVDQGVLRPEDVGRSPFAHVLTSALGAAEAMPSVVRFDLRWTDIVLLCTDGLTKHVPDERIREHLMAGATAEATCRALVEDALAGGGSDNITVVVGRTRPGSSPP
jgi:protein phosphatase